jgi:tetratricopeptide (TPR) repeat protein
MTALSEISLAAVCRAPGPPVLTDGAIAVLNLQAQIDGLEGHGTSTEAGTLLDLLILRGLILGRVRDYERAAQLADHLVHDTAAGAAGYMARARTRAVFHRFSEALDDLDHADRISPEDTHAKQERAAILQALGRYHEALATYEDAAGRGAQFEQAGALAGLWADRGETDAAQRLYLESLRTYRGVSPFPLALVDFHLGTDVDEARPAGSGAHVL